MSTADEHRQKAWQADMKALQLAGTDLQQHWEDLARGWRQVADHVDWLSRGRKGSPPLTETGEGK